MIVWRSYPADREVLVLEDVTSRGIYELGVKLTRTFRRALINQSPKVTVFVPNPGNPRVGSYVEQSTRHDLATALREELDFSLQHARAPVEIDPTPDVLDAIARAAAWATIQEVEVLEPRPPAPKDTRDGKVPR
ncbi:MAG: hypothetical protein V3S03_08510 [Vicinamibacteria bacterium]